MRQAIMIIIKANDIPVTGELWFKLVFMTEEQLKRLCHELHIETPE